MRALIICSVHALCDVSRLERTACNHAFELHGIPAILTERDHADILGESTMLAFLRSLPGSPQQRRELIESYLELLNDHLWSASLTARQNVFSALLDPFGFARPRAFLSEYPMLTTNLVRSSALLTNATKLGTLSVPSDPVEEQCTETCLAASAASLELAHRDVEVLVAHERDFDAALSIGMHPSYVQDVSPGSTTAQREARSRRSALRERSLPSSGVSRRSPCPPAATAGM